MQQEQPPSTDIVVLPASGEVIDLRESNQVARAFSDIREMESQLREVKGVLADALIAHSARLGSRTMHLDVAKVEVRGGTETVYAAQEIKRELLAAGMAPERVAEIVVETIDYKVSAVEAKRAAAANPEYAEIIERHKQVYVKRPSVSVS